MLTIFWMCLNMFECCYSLLSMVEYSLWCWWCWMTNIDQWYFTPTHITISVTWGNASSASQNKKRQQRKGSKTKSMTASLGIGADTPGYEMKLAPAAVRSSFLFAEPKMRTLQKFVHMAGQERVDKKDPMSNSKFQRYYLHVLSWFCNWTCAGDFRKLPFIIWNLLPSWPWQEEEPVFEDTESWKSDPSTQYVHVCSRSSNTMYKHSWALSLDMLYTIYWCLSNFTSLHQNSDPNYLPKVHADTELDGVSLGSLGLVSALRQGEHLGEFRWWPQPWWLTLEFLGWAHSAAGLNPCQPANVKPQDTSVGIDQSLTVPRDTPDIFW